MYNQDLPEEHTENIEESVPIVHLSPSHNEYQDSLNNGQANMGNSSSLTIDGTPNCRRKPPLPQSLPQIEGHQSYDCSHYTASPQSAEYPGELSSPYSCRKDSAYHQYVKSTQKPEHHCVYANQINQECSCASDSLKFLQNRRIDV